MSNTNHIITLSIAVDDETIQRQAMEYCAREVSKCLDDGYLRRGSYGKMEFDYKLIEAIGQSCNNFLDAHADEIMNATVNKLVEKVCRSRAFKESIQNDILEAAT